MLLTTAILSILFDTLNFTASSTFWGYLRADNLSTIFGSQSLKEIRVGVKKKKERKKK